MAEFASKGVGNAALTTGIIGTAGTALSGVLGNIFGGGQNWACGDNMAVNRYELSLNQEIASKDARIGLLESQVYTDQKLVEVVKDYTGQIKELEKEVRANKDAQCAINAQQAVYNGTANATLACMQGQIAQLFGLTQLKIGNDSVCPGWGTVTITPAAAPAAGA